MSTVNTITTFVNLLAVLDQNPGTQWDDLLERVELKTQSLADAPPQRNCPHCTRKLANPKASNCNHCGKPIYA